MSEKLTEIYFNNFYYRVSVDSPNVGDVQFYHNYPKSIQEQDILYSICSLENYHIEALEKKYLYSRHPEELNDLTDCNYSLLDSSNVNVNEILDFLYNNGFDKNKVEQNRNNPLKLQHAYLVGLFNKRFSRLGIISLTGNFKNMLLWAYYCKNQGFAIGYDTNELKKVNNLYGPYPINYIEDLQKIDLNRYDEALCFFFQTNVKYSIWRFEEEWRFFAFSTNPPGDSAYHPAWYPQGKMSRHISYTKINPIREIILGFNFFKYTDATKIETITDGNKFYEKIHIKLNPNDYSYSNKTDLVKIILERKMLCYTIVRHPNKYQLDKVPTKIEQISSNEYIVRNEIVPV